MLDNQTLVIAIKHIPPFIDFECLPNGSSINEVTKHCEYPGVDIQVLAMLLQSVKLNGVIVHTTTVDEVTQLLYTGQADITGFTFGSMHFVKSLNRTLLEISSLPVYTDSAMFVTKSVHPTLSMSNAMVSIFRLDLWLGLAGAIAVAYCIRKILRWFGLRDEIVENGRGWLFLIASGLFTNILAVKMATPRVISSPYKSVAEMVTKIGSGQCDWRAPEEVYITYVEGVFQSSTSPIVQSLRALEKQVPFKRLPESVINSADWTGVHYILHQQDRSPDSCQILVQFGTLQPFIIQETSRVGISIEILEEPLTKEHYGWVFRRGLPPSVKRQLIQISSDKSLPSLYSEILKRMAAEAARKAVFSNSPNPGPAAMAVEAKTERNTSTSQALVALEQVVEVFQYYSYGLAASLMLALLEVGLGKLRRRKVMCIGSKAEKEE